MRNIIPSIKYAKERRIIAYLVYYLFSGSHRRVLFPHSRSIDRGRGSRNLPERYGRYWTSRNVGATGEKYQGKTSRSDCPISWTYGPGLSMASILEVCENGADIIDVAMEPLSWGKVHPDVISVQAMLKNAGFRVPEINMKLYESAQHDARVYR